MSLGRNVATAWKSPRWRAALLVAVVSDALGFGVVLLPPVQWLLDAVTAVALLAVLGFRWTLLVAPWLSNWCRDWSLFPAWTLMVAALAATDNSHPPASIETRRAPLGAPLGRGRGLGRRTDRPGS